MRVKSLSYVGILVLLALLSGWLLASIQSALRIEGPRDSQAPLLSVDQIQASVMNIQGVREYTLIAPRLIHLPGGQGTQVQNPQLEIFQQDGSTQEWLIRAERAWVSADTQVVRLEEAVSLTRTEASGAAPLAITARNVSVRPNEGYAESAEAVSAQTPQGVLNAIGFKAYLHREQVELLSQVRGTYVPPKD